MKKIILIFTLLVLTLYSSANASEVVCKVYDVKCKMKKFTGDTKEFQKKKWEKAGKKLKNSIGNNK